MVFLHFVFLSQVFFYGLTDTFSSTFDPSLLRIVTPTSASPPPLAAVWRAVAMSCLDFQTSIRTIDRPSSMSLSLHHTLFQMNALSSCNMTKILQKSLEPLLRPDVQLYKDGFICASGPKCFFDLDQHR